VGLYRLAILFVSSNALTGHLDYQVVR
jgi:hypothetical protein